MPSSPRCVLLVDDDPDVLEAMSLVLDSAGYRVWTATNGAEALERLRTEHEPPGVILLDLMMPVLNGWEFRDQQLRDLRLAAIPLIVVTGAGQGAQRASSLGADGVLEKPVTLDALLATAQRYCDPQV